MIVLGLTGSIGMGKSATALLFAEEGVPVYDADAAVHALYDFGGAAVEAIGKAFPGAASGGFIDRKRLGEAVLDNPEALARLERIVHPLLLEGREDFLARARASGVAAAVLDIPLLFETGADRSVDAVVVVSAPEPVQRDRVLARPGMTEAKFEAIRARQAPDAEKRARADFIIDTGQGVDAARKQVRRVLASVADPGFRPRRARPSDTLDEAAEPPH